MLKTLAISIALCGSLAASVRADNQAVERLIVLDEGTWQADNGRLSYYEDGQVISNSWFRDVNGYKLGDTPEDIIQVRDNLIAISVNWSNIIQFIDEQGKAVAATEDMRRRFAKIFGEEDAKRLEFRTINGISQKVLQYFAYRTQKTPF